MSSEKFDLKENDLQLSDFSNGVQNENMETIIKDKTFNQNIDNSIENNLENGLNDENNSNSDQQIANNFNTNGLYFFSHIKKYINFETFFKSKLILSSITINFKDFNYFYS